MSNKSVNPFSENTPEIEELARICKENDVIDPSLYYRYNVKRGLRDENGKGVLTGLTEIAEVKSYTIDDDEMVPCPGKLYYRGYNIEDLVKGFSKEKRFGFEETTYLLMFGKLPNKDELKAFEETVESYRQLPTNFVRDIIMKAPSKDMMNTLMRSVLTLYAYDDNPDSTAVENVLRQCLALYAVMPMLAVYGYQAFEHYKEGQSLFIHQPKSGLSTAETILHLLRPDSSFTKTEARILDLCLVLHADHGGGNNSAFTTRVVTSTMTDTYSTTAAALASLKGPRHGGANIKVDDMMAFLKSKVRHWDDDNEIRRQLERIISGKSFDKSGLIYGMGHAVYTISDPRAVILSQFVEKLAAEKGCLDEYEFYKKVEQIGTDVIATKKKMNRANICANVDFYSGFVYRMLGLPHELFTPIFAIARTAGWEAHRLEEIATGSKIIRPAYKNVVRHAAYVPIKKR